MKLNRILLALLAVGVAGAVTNLGAATVSVSGAGLLRDRELRKSLERLLEAEGRATMDTNAIEDAGVILVAALGAEGFQNPKIQIEATLTDGTTRNFEFDSTFTNPLPRPLPATAVKFQLDPGERSRVEQVDFVGLNAMPVDEAESFFRSQNTLITMARTNAYSPAALNRGEDALLSELRQLGFARSEVRAEKTGEVDGMVSLQVTVQEGPRWLVREVRFQGDEAAGVTLPDFSPWVGRPWSPTVQVDIREATRRAYYEQGYPDVQVNVEPGAGDVVSGQVEVPVVVAIESGQRVDVGQVRFQGNLVTREAVLRRRVAIAPGEPLNPLELEQARYRISRLGVFDSVDLQYEPENGQVRDAIFSLRESAPYETSVLLGYGSYEQVRVGLEHRQTNVFGRAHQSRIQVVQSIKSTSGDYTYAVPELFGESIDGSARLFGLQRKEIAFLRQEFGLNLTLRRAIPRTGGDVLLGYTFEALRNQRNSLSTRATDESQVNAASVNFGISGDRRDNRLRPRQGYHWSARLEAADPRLGGQTAFQRFEIGGAYHTAWGRSRWVHLGLTHGVITTLGADDRTLPVNKRFFPGGDNSIRGYQRGEAAPRGTDGLFVGAKTYLLLNFELEQALTPNWSLVAFCDALGAAIALRDYPFQERLYTAGLGVRYQTLIGPLRLEYGRNLNPRAADPPGTWQLSMGYPF